jgi:hypothetical protein
MRPARWLMVRRAPALLLQALVLGQLEKARELLPEHMHKILSNSYVKVFNNSRKYIVKLCNNYVIV